MKVKAKDIIPTLDSMVERRVSLERVPTKEEVEEAIKQVNINIP